MRFLFLALAASALSIDQMDRLERIAKLRKDGTVTEEQFVQIRSNIMTEGGVSQKTELTPTRRALVDDKDTVAKSKCLASTVAKSAKVADDCMKTVTEVTNPAVTAILQYLMKNGGGGGDAGKDKKVEKPYSCAQILDANDKAKSGVYEMTFGHIQVKTYCEMGNFGGKINQPGGWTLVYQRRDGNNNLDDKKGAKCLGQFLHSGGWDPESAVKNTQFSYSINLANEKYFKSSTYLITWHAAGKPGPDGIDVDDSFIIRKSKDQLLMPATASDTATSNKRGENCYCKETTTDQKAALSSRSLIQSHVLAICMVDGSKCDTDNVHFNYIPSGYQSGTECQHGTWCGSHPGIINICQDGAKKQNQGTYNGNRSGYDQAKLWNHGSKAREHAERLWYK